MAGNPSVSNEVLLKRRTSGIPRECKARQKKINLLFGSD